MNDQLEHLINKIELDFADLEAAIQHIRKAENVSTSVVNAVKLLPQKYSESLTSIESLVKGDMEKQIKRNEKLFKILSEKTDDLISKLEGLDFNESLLEIHRKIDNRFKDYNVFVKGTEKKILEQLANSKQEINNNTNEGLSKCLAFINDSNESILHECEKGTKLLISTIASIENKLKLENEKSNKLLISTIASIEDKLKIENEALKETISSTQMTQLIGFGVIISVLIYFFLNIR